MDYVIVALGWLFGALYVAGLAIVITAHQGYCIAKSFWPMPLRLVRAGKSKWQEMTHG